MEEKQLNFEKPEFLSEKQFQEHLKLYQGYVKKSEEIEGKFASVDLKDTNASQSAVRSLILGETFANNGARLHKYYFENISTKKTAPEGKILRVIEDEWKSFDSFREEVLSFASSSRGWIILAWDIEEKRIRLFGTDQHDISVWAAIPILVLDVYEHAYFMDYGTDKKKYVEEFLNHIDWKVLDKRLKALK